MMILVYTLAYLLIGSIVFGIMMSLEDDNNEIIPLVIIAWPFAIAMMVGYLVASLVIKLMEDGDD